MTFDYCADDATIFSMGFFLEHHDDKVILFDRENRTLSEGYGHLSDSHSNGTFSPSSAIPLTDEILKNVQSLKISGDLFHVRNMELCQCQPLRYHFDVEQTV